MREIPEKTWLAIAIDFFFGAAFADFVMGFGWLRSAGREPHSDWSQLWILTIATTLIFGSLAALFRNDYWSGYETYTVIPPVEERLSKRSKLVLWSVFALGCVLPGLLLIW